MTSLVCRLPVANASHRSMLMASAAPGAMASAANDSAPPTADDINEKTSAGFAAMHIITACCSAVLNTVFIAPDPKPDWFDDLNAKLDAAKALAHEWNNQLAPAMTSSIPVHVTSYDSTFQAMTDRILKIADEHPDASGPDNKYVQQVAALTQELENEVSRIIREVEETADQLNDWGDRMQKAHDELYEGASNIQALQTDLAADIAKMNTAIAGLKAQIDFQNQVIAGSAIGIGVGIFSMIVGVALAPLTGGWSLLATAGGFLAVVGGGITWGVMQDKINKEFDEIAEDQKRLDDDQRQLVALQGLSMAADTAVTATGTAASAVSDVKEMWGFFQGELQDVLNKLHTSDEKLSVLMKSTWVDAARNEWTKASRYAEQLMGLKVPQEEKTLPMDSNSQAA